MISSLSSKTFDRLQTVLTSRSPIIWLTYGVNEGQSVGGAMAKGMLRSLRSEQASARIVLLDADGAEGVESVAEVVVDMLGNIPTKDSGDDTEFWLSLGELSVPRVVTNDALNQHFSSALAPPQSTVLSSEHMLSGKGEDGALVFTPIPHSGEPLAATDVDMQVLYASVDASTTTTLSATTTLSVVAGPILAVGSDLPADFIGQNAVAYAPSAFDTRIQTPITLGTFSPSDVDLSTLVAMLPSLATALDTVSDVGKVQSGEHVVLLPAPQEFVRAVCELRQALGFQLTVIAETDQQTSELAHQWTLGRGKVISSTDTMAVRALFRMGEPDLVIAQAFSPLSRESWRSMPSGSRFVLNDSNITGHLDTLPLSHGVSFLLSGVETMYKRRKHLLGDLSRRTIEFIQEHGISWTPIVCDIETFTDLRAAEKHDVVIRYGYGVSSVLVRSMLITQRTFSPHTNLQ